MTAYPAPRGRDLSAEGVAPGWILLEGRRGSIVVSGDEQFAVEHVGETRHRHLPVFAVYSRSRRPADADAPVAALPFDLAGWTVGHEEGEAWLRGERPLWFAAYGSL